MNTLQADEQSLMVLQLAAGLLYGTAAAAAGVVSFSIIAHCCC